MGDFVVVVAAVDSTFKYLILFFISKFCCDVNGLRGKRLSGVTVLDMTTPPDEGSRGDVAYY